MQMELGARLEQRQVLSQAQIQSLYILSLPTQPLQQMMQREYQENPCMEERGCAPELTESGEPYRLSAPHCGRPAPGPDDPQPDAGELAAPETDRLQRQVLEQLNPQKYTKADWRAIRYMIACLDRNGYFKTPLGVVALANHISLERAADLLEALQGLEPAGLFAADLRQCLLVQLQRQPQSDPLAVRIVREHLDELATNKTSRLAQSLGVSTARVRQAVEAIRALDPRPGAGFGCGETMFVQPDVSAEYRDGRWQITIHDEWRERYGLNRNYAALAHTAPDPELRRYCAEKAQRVRFLMDSVKKRHDTLYALTQAVLERQGAFLRGEGPLQPLTMTELAERLGLSYSTVSRAMREKYLCTRRGVVCFKELFCTGSLQTAADSGAQVAAGQVKQRLRQLIESEQPTRPYSDQSIAARLTAEGVRISRRTVTKYRLELGYADSRERQAACL